MDEWREIYDFWFGAPDSASHGEVRDFWFDGSPDLDREIERRFHDQHMRAAAGEYAEWKTVPRGFVSLILLLDQVPRNIFRGSGRSFATDPLALAAARELVQSPLHEQLITVEKLFAYLPFEHSEDIADQQRCVTLYEAIDPHKDKEEWIEFAALHKDIVEKFGRFPHRNHLLGRETTAEERVWLESTDQRFGTAPEDDNPA